MTPTEIVGRLDNQAKTSVPATETEFKREERLRLICESVCDNLSRIIGEEALAGSKTHINLLRRMAVIREANAKFDGRECDLSDLEPSLAELRRRAN